MLLHILYLIYIDDCTSSWHEIRKILSSLVQNFVPGILKCCPKDLIIFMFKTGWPGVILGDCSGHSISLTKLSPKTHSNDIFSFKNIHTNVLVHNGFNVMDVSVRLARLAVLEPDLASCFLLCGFLAVRKI